jgi:hypothetical protein
MTSLQKEIFEKYKGDYLLDKPLSKDTCNVSTPFGLTKKQQFIAEYFTPSNKDGVFLYHTVGSGKTLTAINLMKRFEKKGYHTLWVTRTTLKKDLEKALKMVALQKPLVTLSYKQFSNVGKGKGEIYKKLIKRTKHKDPLYNTIVVIDEVHKLYTKDLKAQEMHDIKSIERMIFDSYSQSGDSRARVVLMSATPITKEPNEIIQLINLIKTTPKERLPLKNFDEKQFTQAIQGLFSYYNTVCDYSKFAKKTERKVVTELSGKNEDKNKCYKAEVWCKNAGFFNNEFCAATRKNCVKDVSYNIKNSQVTALKKRCL